MDGAGSSDHRSQKYATGCAPFCISFYFRTVIGSAVLWSPSPIITVLEIAPSLLQPINIGPFFLFPRIYTYASIPQIRENKKNNSVFHGVAINLVPVIGVEPIRYRYRGILSPVRLPIPPHRQACIYYHCLGEKSSVFIKKVMNTVLTETNRSLVFSRRDARLLFLFPDYCR